MALQTYSFSQLVSHIATAMQAAATAALDFTVGSVNLAASEAVAGVILWLQAIIIQLLTLTRAATSEDDDLDSWMADFNFDRLPASYATGLVTFSRFTPTMQAVVPINAAVQTGDGTQSFFVTLDTTNAAYNAALSGYVIAANTASVTVPVQAVNAGTQGNVIAGAISHITSGIQYVDTATNASAFINGVDAELNPAFRARFVLYLASLSKATLTAVRYAATSLQQDVVCNILENLHFNGTADLGFFTAVIDDGSGYPSSSLLNAAYSAIDGVRPLGSRFAVSAPTVATANVSMTIVSAAGFTHSTVVAAVVAALQNFINALPLGTSLPYTQLAAIAYSVPGVINASSVLLNSSTADVTADQKTKVLAGTMTVA